MLPYFTILIVRSSLNGLQPMTFSKYVCHSHKEKPRLPRCGRVCAGVFLNRQVSRAFPICFFILKDDHISSWRFGRWTDTDSASTGDSLFVLPTRTRFREREEELFTIGSLLGRKGSADVYMLIWSTASGKENEKKKKVFLGKIWTDKMQRNPN